jgi:hypothetical protein
MYVPLFNAANMPKEERLRAQCGCLGNVDGIVKNVVSDYFVMLVNSS